MALGGVSQFGQQGVLFIVHGCQNQHLWDPNQGHAFSTEDEGLIFNECRKPFCGGISWLGGEPLADWNADEVIEFSRRFRIAFPEKTIWMWSGYEFSVIKADPRKARIIDYADVLVTGPFIEELKTLSCKWRGSTNQEVIKLTDRDVHI